MAIFSPSGEYRNAKIDSDVKGVNGRLAEPSTGRTHRLCPVLYPSGHAGRQHQSLRRAQKSSFASDSSLHFPIAALFSPPRVPSLVVGRGPAVIRTWRMQ
jgi:hypothetical protein